MSDAQSEPRLGRRERKKQEVEKRIREAALELFRHKGYQATSVEEIAERADVAKGTVFNYFPRKDSLLEALAADLLDEVYDQLGPVEEWVGTAREQLLRLFLCIGDLVARDPDLSKIMMIENMRRFWMRTGADPLEEEFMAMVCGVLSAGVDRGEISGRVDIGLSAKLLEAAYFTTIVEWMKCGAPADVYRTQLTAKFDIIFRGLAPVGRTSIKAERDVE